MAVEINLEALKKINNKDKYLMFGYFRTVSKEMIKSYYDNIPDLIVYICLSYFYHTHFGYLGLLTVLSKDKRTITKTSSSWVGINYGSETIHSLDKCVCRWRLKINKRNTEHIYIGIGTAGYENLQNIWRNYGRHPNTEYYLYSGNGDKINHEINTILSRKYGEEYKKGDIIEVELNLSDRRVTFYKNDESQGIAFRYIKTAKDLYYKLMVTMYGKNTKVTLENFERFG